jgi:Tle cognate immunity protein 4 C-terminal domain
MIRRSSPPADAGPGRSGPAVQAVAVLLVFLAGASCATTARRSVVNGPLRTYFAGHFKFELPASYQRDPDDVSKVRGLPIESVTLPSAATAAQAKAAFWQKHLAKLADQPKGYSEPIIIETNELKPGVPCVLTRGDHKLDRILEAFVADDDHGVLIKTEWSNYGDEAEQTSAGPEARQVLKDVVAAHRFLPSGYTPPDPDWFYLPNGAIALPYTASVNSQDELQILFVEPERGIKFSFEAIYPWRGRDSNTPGFLARTVSAVAEWAFGTRILRSGHRTVAGFPGEESLLRLKSEDGDQLMFSWVYEPAESARGYQPKIVVQLESAAADAETKVAQWDQALDSIKRLNGD